MPFLNCQTTNAHIETKWPCFHKAWPPSLSWITFYHACSLVPSSSNLLLACISVFTHSPTTMFWFSLCQPPHFHSFLDSQHFFKLKSFTFPLSAEIQERRVSSEMNTWSLHHLLSCLQSVFSLYNLNLLEVISGINLHRTEIFIWLITPSELAPI